MWLLTTLQLEIVKDVVTVWLVYKGSILKIFTLFNDSEGIMILIARVWQIQYRWSCDHWWSGSYCLVVMPTNTQLLLKTITYVLCKYCEIHGFWYKVLIIMQCKAGENCPIAPVLAGPVFLKVKMKINFYENQVISERGSVIFRLARLRQKSISRGARVLAAHTLSL